ncbi:MAG: hypothetical protein KTR31_05385 [Myxococcales bacterium]|nr:hypothetical protein [Myxococcales bacterium]
MIGSLVGLAAWAQVPVKDSEPEASEEIIVVGDAVEQARQAVIDDLVDLGFDRVRERSGRVVLKHGTTWRGKIVLYEDGFLKHRRQGVRVVEGPAKELPKGTRWLPCIIVPTACVRVGATVADRKLNAVRSRTMTAITPQLRTLGDRMADAAVASNLELLPDALEALWIEGRPLGGGSPLATFRARRADLLSFWESRTETKWGEQVRGAVEAYVSEVVQHSDHPFVQREVARFNETTSSSRPFPFP